MRTKRKAFTLMELMIVVVIVGIITVFAIPNYRKAIDKQHERDAITQLKTIASALELYRGQAGVFPDGATMPDVGAINTVLALNVIEGEVVYTCVTEPFSGNGPGFKCSASGAGWQINIETDPVLRLDPFCEDATCPTCTPAGCPM